MLVSSGTDARFWSYVGSVYIENDFLQDNLTHNTSADQFVGADNTGTTETFNDFSSSIPTATASQWTWRSWIPSILIWVLCLLGRERRLETGLTR